MKLLCGLLWLWNAPTVKSDEANEIRIGHFSNVTHAQALYARATRSFEKKLGVPVRWMTLNAGPSVIEALFADAIDVAYVGPNPTINGYMKSEGKGLQIIAGSASGGAALVVRADAGIVNEKGFHGVTIATPQLGNTQDVAARAWFESKGYTLKEKGGTLDLIPLSNSEQLLFFMKKEIAGAWTVEPWVSRLQIEGGGRLFLDEKTLWPGGRYVTTQLIASRKFLERHPELVRKLIVAHIETTQKINADKQAAGVLINREFKRETGKALPDTVIRTALKRLEFTWDPIRSSLKKCALDAYRAHFLREMPDLARIHNLILLNEVLKEKGLPLIP